MVYIDLIYAMSPIYFNAAALSSPKLLILILTLLLVYKLDYIQNLIFYTLVNSSSAYCFVNTIFM